MLNLQQHCFRASRLLRVFGYLQKYKNQQNLIYSKDPIYVGGRDALNSDFRIMLEDKYPDVADEFNNKFPDPLIDELEVAAFVDSDHAHDKSTRISIKGLLILVGRTPVYFMRKRKGAIATGTYGSEL